MTPPEASVPVILEKTAARRMVWVDVARVAACILIIANHMAFYSAELYRWIWAEFLAARTPFFLLAAGYFVGRGSFGPLDGGSLFLWRRSWFLLRPYLVWGLAAAVLIGWSPCTNITRPTGLCMNGWEGKREPGSGLLSRRSAAAWALPGIRWTLPCGFCAISSSIPLRPPSLPFGGLSALGGHGHAVPELFCAGSGGS